MKSVIQRVKQAKVTSEGKGLGKIGKKEKGQPPARPNGLVILLGVGKEDNEEKVREMAQKILDLRIFPSLPAGKASSNKNIDRSVQDIKGEILVVSQFTLCADTSESSRPSFTEAAPPEQAEELYDYFVSYLKDKSELNIETGEFGAMMQLKLINDGPVTIPISL